MLLRILDSLVLLCSIGKGRSGFTRASVNGQRSQADCTHAFPSRTHPFLELELRGPPHGRDKKRHVACHAPHAVEDHDLEQKKHGRDIVTTNTRWTATNEAAHNERILTETDFNASTAAKIIPHNFQVLCPKKRAGNAKGNAKGACAPDVLRILPMTRKNVPDDYVATAAQRRAVDECPCEFLKD